MSRSDLVDIAGEIQGETDRAYRFFDGIRPRDKYADYRFMRQKNGNWMLVRETADV